MRQQPRQQHPGMRRNGQEKMSRKFLKANPVLLTAALLAACAGGTTQRSDEDRPVSTAATGSQCLNIAQARDFRHLAPDNLLVYAPGNQAWHVELSNCRELSGQFQIALRSRTSQLCGVAGDEVIVRGAFTERCPVIRVTRVGSGEIDALIDRFSERPRAEGEFEVVIPQRDE
jgi:hypothetical protein